jgi:hypothetical protein
MVAADAVLWNVPHLMLAAALMVRPVEVLTHLLGEEGDTGSPSNDPEDVIEVYITRGLIKAKKSGLREGCVE